MKVNEPIIGLCVTEEAPPGWKVENCGILDDSALEIMTLTSDIDGVSRITWVLTPREQRIAEGTEISLVYALSAPTTAELGSINLSGTIYVQLLDKAEGPIPVQGHVRQGFNQIHLLSFAKSFLHQLLYTYIPAPPRITAAARRTPGPGSGE